MSEPLAISAPTTSLEIRARIVEALKLDLVGPGAGHVLAEERLEGWRRPSNWYLTGFLIPSGTPAERRADADESEDMSNEVPAPGGLFEESNEERKAAKKAFFPSSMGLSFLVSSETRALDVTVRWGDYEHLTADEGGNAPVDVAADEPTSGDLAESQALVAIDGTASGSAAIVDADTPRDAGGPLTTGPASGAVDRDNSETVSGDAGNDAVHEGAGERSRFVWQRRPREAHLEVRLGGAAASGSYDLPGFVGVQVHVIERTVSTDDLVGLLPPRTRSVSVFLVNHREPVPPDQGEPDRAYLFQPEVEVRCEQPFVPRPDLRGVRAADWDERVADLHYADTPEYATGHGVSAEWDVLDGACRRIRTAWIPSAEVEKTETADVPDVELSMEALGLVADGASVEAALRPLVAQYRSWIEVQGTDASALAGSRGETAKDLLRSASHAATRIDRGIDVLARDDGALDAFRVANRAMARALRKRLGIETPRWRAFQLAFLLLNLPGLADPSEGNREVVDLLFFPTGGGKTEAYLGLAAFCMVLRRLRHPGSDVLEAAGVCVIMRYTLRLLTLDQLGRAAGLVCALELEREQDVGRYGAWPFEIGLWVGKAATPNLMGRKGDDRSDTARSKVRQFKKYPKTSPSPIPLEDCPWCGTSFSPDSFTLQPNDDQPTELRIVCRNTDCDFTRDRALPIVAVDEPLYRRLPAFLIATVDKFASLPWVGPAGALLGGCDRYDAKGFYGAAEPGRGRRLGAALDPPDLVIQDELHLIAGPLGTMAGLYETAIDALCTRTVKGRSIRPKIVASTATARRANEQIQALFARPITQVFPPPGPDRRDAFFARTIPASRTPARLYLGVASQGRNPKVMMRKVWLALMGAAERCYRDAGGHKRQDNPADPYMTIVGYFNSLRELGGARRILEEEVQNTVKSYGGRKRVGEKRGVFQDRKTFSEVVELTSRVSTNKVAEARRRLGVGFDDITQRVDCAIATNMISVGLDIPRLGLMAVLGQPKTHAEYIQATSRVGRADDRPGLVVTLLNFHKPRDRSHYERFRHYHATFYRAVEVSSVTPFSARALDRGFAGALVSLARHAEPRLTPPQGVEQIADVRVELERRLLDVFRERVRQQPFVDEEEREERLRSVQNRVVDLLDAWRAILESYGSVGVAMQYQKYELKQLKPLLREMLDVDFETEHHKKFRANRSLRDVEPEVNLFLRELGGRSVEDRA